jgi:hypothetical protein
MKPRSVIALTLTIIIITILAFSTPAEGSDALKRDLLEDILSLNKPDLFDLRIFYR